MKYMKKLSLFILACICTLGSYADDVAVFNALVNRLLPNYSSQITGKKLPEGKNDYFQLSSVGDRIEIAGNNANNQYPMKNNLSKICPTFSFSSVTPRFPTLAATPSIA